MKQSVKTRFNSVYLVSLTTIETSLGKIHKQRSKENNDIFPELF